MKVGLIRCLQTETVCPAYKCIKAIAGKQDAFSEIKEDTTLLGITTCGGCPGKNAVLRAVNLVKLGAQAIALASCIGQDKPTPIGMGCPHFAAMKAAIEKRVGPQVQVFEYTHN